MDMIPLFKVAMSPSSISRSARVLQSGYVGQGHVVKDFEAELCRIENEWNVLATTSGTHALDLAYHLCGIGPGSSVISTPMTCMATNTQLVVRGAKIIWADISHETGLIDPQSVAEKVSAGVKAIVAVDWAGRFADYESLRVLGVPVIQDGAHSFRGHGGRSDYRVWSFQAIKHVTCGDGGALRVPDDETYRRADLLRWYGLDRNDSSDFRCRQDVSEAGYKYGMNDVAASIGLGNLEESLSVVLKHRKNARFLCEKLESAPYVRVLPYDHTCSYWFFPLLIQGGTVEGFISWMLSKGVAASQVHSRNDTKSCFSGSNAFLPGVDRFSSSQVNIPCGWWLSEEDLERICDSVWGFSGEV